MGKKLVRRKAKQPVFVSPRVVADCAQGLLGAERIDSLEQMRARVEATLGVSLNNFQWAERTLSKVWKAKKNKCSWCLGSGWCRKAGSPDRRRCTRCDGTGVRGGKRAIKKPDKLDAFQDKLGFDAGSKRMARASGDVASSDPLVSFVYILLRDHVTAGKMEKLMDEHIEGSEETAVFSNGWLAQHAKDIAKRLRPEAYKKPKAAKRKQ